MKSSQFLVVRYSDVFLSAANLRSIAKAAAHLGITQSAVSQKIALLESKLSVKLFDWSTRSLTLTPEARKLKESLELYNAQISETIQSIQLKNDLLLEIRFGIIHSITDCIGADLIAKLSARTHRVVHLIGTIKAGKIKPSGVLDVAMAQTLAHQKDWETLSRQYGMIIVDECHHATSLQFETILKRLHGI